MKKNSCSLRIDATKFEGKQLKIICEILRVLIKNFHGYNATRGLTDTRFKAWPQSIRFHNRDTRMEGVKLLKSLLAPEIIKKMQLQRLNKLKGNKNTPVINQSIA